MEMAKPIEKIRAGQVDCAVWKNEIVVNGQARNVLKASIQRRYKDDAGEWKSSTSFSRNEIPLAIHCLRKAFEYMLGLDRDQLEVVEEVVED